MKKKSTNEVCISVDNMKYCYTPDDRPMFDKPKKPKDPTGSDDQVKRILPRNENTQVF